MQSIENLEEYAEDVGGIFSCGDMEAIPYNHWKKDCEWIILLLDQFDSSTVFIPVRALTAKQACEIAFYQYTTHLEKDDEL